MIQFLVRFLRHPVKNWLILRHPIAFLIQWVRVTNKPLAKVCVLNYEKSVKNRICKNKICSDCQNTYLYYFFVKKCAVWKKNRQIMVSNTRLDSLHMTHSLPLQGRISERMSCEVSSIFFANLAYIPHLGQNHSSQKFLCFMENKRLYHQGYGNTGCDVFKRGVQN